MSDAATAEQKPSFPYVEFLVTRNPGKPNESREQWFFNLESSAGTFEHVQRYEMKGWPIVGYGNLLHQVARGGVIAADTMADEHAKIRTHVDNQLLIRNQAVASARKEFAAEIERDSIARKIEKAKEDKKGSADVSK